MGSGAVRDGRIIAVAILGAVAAWLGSLALGSEPGGWLRPVLAAVAALAGIASVGVLIGNASARRLASLFAGLMAVIGAVGAVVVPVGMILSMNNPDRQWQWGFGYLLQLAAAVFLIWSLSTSAQRDGPAPQPRRLLFAAPVVLGLLLAAVALGGDSSRRAAALPEYQLAPPDATMLSEGGRPNESSIWGRVPAWAGRTYASDDSPESILGYYVQVLDERGWTDAGSGQTTGDTQWRTWERDGFRYQVTFDCGLQPDATCAPAHQFRVRIYVP
jgi:hypothetical protein